MNSKPRELIALNEASRLLAETRSLEEIKSIRDKAVAARAYAKAARLGLDLQNRAAELKLRAERKAGSFLAALHLRGGDRKSKRQSAALKLSDLGISRDQSRRWQSIASVAEKDFEHYLELTNVLGREVTSAGLLRISNRAPGSQREQPFMRRNQASMDTVDYASVSDDLIMELTNHCQLLASVLRPIYEGRETQFKQGERRIVGRLLGAMSELIGQLKSEWPRIGHTSKHRAMI